MGANEGGAVLSRLPVGDKVGVGVGIHLSQVSGLEVVQLRMHPPLH